MTMRPASPRFTLLACTVLLATACTAQTPDTTSATASTAASAATATVASASSAAVSAASTAAASAASASAPAVSAAADAAVATSTIPPPKGFPPGPTPVEGTDYTLIDTPDLPGGDKVTVTEVFGYGCPHCNALQEPLSKWEKTLPSDVEFVYMPAAFGGGPPHCWDEFARAFYTAQAMGIQVKSHEGVYKAVWQDHRFVDCSSIPPIYADYGADPKVFASTMQSFAVSAKVSSAHEQVLRWGVDSTPTIVVDGKYRVQELTAGGPDAMFHTIEWLIAKQRPDHAKH